MLLMLGFCSANAAVIYGGRDGAVAEVTGSIVKQTEYLDMPGNAPAATDGYLHITLKVTNVIFGPIHRGNLQITRWTTECLKTADGRVTLYLNIGTHGWSIWEPVKRAGAQVNSPAQ